MVSAVKPLMTGETMRTFLDPFCPANKAACFEEVLKSVFMKGIHKSMITFVAGCEKDIAIAYAKNRKAEYVEVEMSSQLLELSDIKDISGRTIFSNDRRTFGWFIFIDENVFANWGHDCKYIFYVNEEMFFEEQMLLPPDTGFPMEAVE
ncbi:MAG: hypothetical protein LBI60_07010 [Bacteroidales bacterium]|jgi:hypothetical protein|nr:hypothetical protein [Bacteroidales bacterium]